MGAAFSALIGRKSKLNPMDWSFSGFDHIFLGFPVWAGHSVPAINGFVKKAGFKGKKVYLLCTAADPDPAKAQVIMDGIAAKIKAKGGEIAGSCFVCSPLKEPLDTDTAPQNPGDVDGVTERKINIKRAKRPPVTAGAIFICSLIVLLALFPAGFFGEANYGAF